MITIINYRNRSFSLGDGDAPFLVGPSVLRAHQFDKMILKVPQELLKQKFIK